MNAMAEPATTSSSESPQPKPDLPLVIVDASNVAFGLEGGGRKARFRLLAHVMAQIPRTGCEMKVVADASLRHRMDDRRSYEEYIRAGFILQAPAGRSADQFIRQLAESRKAKGQRVLVLSNDLFRQLPGFQVDRIAFMAVGEEEVLFDPLLKAATEGSGRSQLASEESPSFIPEPF